MTERTEVFGDRRPPRHQLAAADAFSQTDHSIDGCVFGPLRTGCSIQLVGQDPTTQALLFYSTCDPLGANPNGGQIFAMQPDGSGLRQLTETRGLITEADGTVTAELPGPFAFFSPSW